MTPRRAGVVVALSCFALGGCGGQASEELRTADVIQSCSPVASPLSDEETMAYMAGRYRVVMIRDTERAQVIGVLDLEQTPDAFQDWGASMATLSGSVDVDLEAVGAQPMRGLDSTDPAAPGALVLESRGSAGPSIVLRLGSDVNRQDQRPFDAAFAALDIRVIEGDRFAGAWHSGVEADRVEGYFCAQRIDP